MNKLFVLISLAACTLGAAQAQEADPDPNFHIYLCIGQSNMEGNAQIEPVDRADVPERFEMMAAVDYANPERKMYNWYKAVPPLVREHTGLTPIDYFGRTMVENLPDSVRVGVIAVAIGGCKIEHLDKDYDPAQLSQEADWFKGFMQAYDNHPYQRLVACAKEAQRSGVIKGILLHQGCSNTNDARWPAKVNKIYHDLLADLSLDAEDVPLLAGEVVSSDMGGVCGSMNSIIDILPQTVPTAHVISSANLAQKGDGLHFTSHAYRVLGTRYATAMLQCEGIDNPVVSYSEQEPYVPSPVPTTDDLVFSFDTFDPCVAGQGTFDSSDGTFMPSGWGLGGWSYDTPIDLSGYRYLVVELAKPSAAMVVVRDSKDERGPAYIGQFNGKTLLVAELNGMMKSAFGPGSDGSIESLDTSKVYTVGLMSMGQQPVCIKQIFATDVNPYAVAEP